MWKREGIIVIAILLGMLLVVGFLSFMGIIPTERFLYGLLASVLKHFGVIFSSIVAGVIILSIKWTLSKKERRLKERQVESLEEANRLTKQKMKEEEERRKPICRTSYEEEGK